MAVVTTKSGSITNRDATPQVMSNAILNGGMIRECAGTVELANGDSIGSKYIMCTLPSNARVSSILIYLDAITTCAADFGLYQTTANGSAVVDADFFASAQSLASASALGIEVAHEATGTYDIDDAEKPLWSALGLSSDPGIGYDLVATLTAAAGSAGTLSVKAKYVI